MYVYICVYIYIYIYIHTYTYVYKPNYAPLFAVMMNSSARARKSWSTRTVGEEDVIIIIINPRRDAGLKRAAARARDYGCCEYIHTRVHWLP